MKREVIDFYRSKHLEIFKLINKGRDRYGLYPYAVTEAAKEVYQEIQDGLQIKDIQIAWLVFDKAKAVVIPDEQLMTLEELNTENRVLHAKHVRDETIILFQAFIIVTIIYQIIIGF